MLKQSIFFIFGYPRMKKSALLYGGCAFFRIFLLKWIQDIIMERIFFMRKNDAPAIFIDPRMEFFALSWPAQILESMQSHGLFTQLMW
jgi:hypothetical protein